LHLEDRVVLTGTVPTSELYAHIHASRALILPSVAENLPSVILEAFALRRPVIATSVGGIPELVASGVNGWLVPSGSAEALECAMHEALDADLETLERMGRAGRRQVMDRFRSADAARQLLGWFQS
jgi:glycosyltransferase involved in cell wall biosynthesis